MDQVLVGKIVNTRGLKGEVKIITFTDFIDKRFNVGNKLTYFSNDKKHFLTIKAKTFKKNFLFVLFEEIDSIDKAENLKNKELYFNKDKLEKLEEDNYYYHQLLELKVYYNSKNIGEICEVFSNGSSEVIRVKLLDKENTILIPFVSDFIENIFLDKKEIYLKNLGSLYEN